MNEADNNEDLNTKPDVWPPEKEDQQPAEDESFEDMMDLDLEEPDLDDLYNTDPRLERAGTPLELGKATFRVAHAGSSNTAYTMAMAKNMRPYRKILEKKDLDNMDEKTLRLVRGLEIKTYAETIVLGWSHKDLGPGKIMVDGKPLEFNQENVEKLFKMRPKIFEKVQQHATSIEPYRGAEGDLKN